MPGPQGADRGPHCGGVKLAGEAQRDRYVVERAVLGEPVEEVEPSLGVRQGRVAGPRHDRQAGAGCLAAQPGDPLGQVGQRLGLQEHRQRQLDVECLAQPGHGLHRKQRVATELEEAGVPADRLHRQAEHLGPDLGDRLFAWGGRRFDRGLGAARAGGAAHARQRQRLAVHLAAGRERQRGEHHDMVGDHVLRQFPAQRLAQLGLLGTGTGDVPDQAALPRQVLAEQHHRLVNRRQAGQRGLDLPQLDPVAAHLDLCVDPAEALQLTVGAQPGQVAGAVHPGAGFRSVGIGQEPLGGQVGPVPVAAGDTGPGDVELADGTPRHRRQVTVEHVQAGVGDRPADRHGRAQVGALADLVDAAADDGLGRAVLVDDPQARDAPAPGGGGTAVQRLAAHDQVAVGRHGGRWHRLVERVEVRRGEFHQAVVDLPVQGLGQRGELLAVGDEHDRAAAQQRGEQRGDREIESQR